MAITLAQATSNTGDAATSVSKAFAGNVTNGGLITVSVIKWIDNAGRDAFVIGDISKSAGTATLGTWTLDVQTDRNTSSNYWIASAVYSVPITGNGSCTIQVAGMLAGSYSTLAIAEWASADTGAGRVAGTNSATGSSAAPDSGTVASGGGGVFVGCGVFDAGSAITVTEDAAFTLIAEWQDPATHEPSSHIYRIVTTNTTDSSSWALSSSMQWCAAMAVYKESAGVIAPVGRLIQVPQSIMRASIY